MSLDINKLTNVKKLTDGKTTARCPACQAAGGDAKGEHLVIYADGKYGCVANPKDSAHTKEIFKLVGIKADVRGLDKITVKSVKIPESSVIMDLGRFSRFTNPKPMIPMPVQTSTREIPSTETAEQDVAEEQAFIRSDGQQRLPEPAEEVSGADAGFDCSANEEDAATFLDAETG